MKQQFSDFMDTAQQLLNNGQAFVLVTLVHVEGHVPQNVGARAIVNHTGLVWGTVGGGRLEARAIEASRAMLDKGQNSPVSVRYDLQRDLNMVCGGAAILLFEPQINQPWNIAVFGAGHVAQAVVPLLSTLACQIRHIDPRQEWLAKVPARPNVLPMVCQDASEVVKDLPADTYFVVMTQGHATDLPIVRSILTRGRPPYLGVIGSSVKARQLKAQLINDGFDREWVEAIRSPIGLPIGSNQPAEIAISVAAELLQFRQQLHPGMKRTSLNEG